MQTLKDFSKKADNYRGKCTRLSIERQEILYCNLTILSQRNVSRHLLTAHFSQRLMNALQAQD